MRKMELPTMLIRNQIVAMEQPQQQAEVFPPPPLPNRRPKARVREVSSRFLSPLVPSNTVPSPTPTPTAEFLRSKSVQRRRQRQEQEPFSPSRADGNIPDTIRSFDGDPLLVAFGLNHHTSKAGGAGSSMSSAQRKYLQRAKLSKENTEGAQVKQQQQHPSRPDTPIVVGADRDRIISSRYRLATQSSHRPTATDINGGGAVTAAAKLLQEATSGTRNESNDDRAAVPQKRLPRISRSKDDSSYFHTSPAATQQGGSCPSSPVCISSNRTQNLQQQGGSCPSSPVCISSNKTRTLTDMRSSMPEVDMLPPMSTRWPPGSSSHFTQTGEMSNDFGSSKFASSPCSRSLNFAVSSGENSSSSSSWLGLRASDVTVASTPSKPFAKNQMGNLCLPPHPSCLKFGSDARIGRKLFINQEDVHSLKLLYNHYLQWRFVNAKAEVSMSAQRIETKRQLKSLGSKLSEMRDALKRKRIELVLLQSIKTLSQIVESQMPYLDQWSAMEENYLDSLSGVMKALLNLSVRLSISGQIKVDVMELAETFDSAGKVMEMIAFNIKSFMVKAEETESLISDVARVVGGERALIEEYRYSLFNAYASQVEECSLRGHLFQLWHSTQGVE